MPSRISLPKLSLFSSSRHSSSSSSSAATFSPPTSASPSKRTSTSSTPVSPPARLHLRNILPASLEEPAIMPPPPRTPRAWVWQCHRCMTVYRLGCTRRCLDCSHTYCVSVTPKSEKTSRGKKRRRQAGMCGAEFDYTGWEQWGSWRRKVLGYESLGRCEPKARDQAYLQKRHNCWIDCDSPSQCCHRRYELAAEALMKQNYIPEAVDEPKSPSIVASVPLSPDDELPLNEAIELTESPENVDDETSPKSPKSPLSQPSFTWNEPEPKKKQKGEEQVWWADGVAFEKSSPDPQKRSGVKVEDDSAGAPSKDNVAQGRPGSRLTVRNLTENDVVEDSDSDSD
ncbi:hypothetical protein HD806DRAFT_80453 [Xylariaceae sp. AK1471]|nr:hypothetical protein HD806DRAFT_80453 [Xylariaceae sp. AK1471]